MPNISPIQPAFNGGEVSGRVAGRVDLDVTKRALSYCKNWMPLPQGSLLLRGGTERVARMHGDRRTRVVRFRMSDAQDYALAFEDHLVRIYDLATGLVQRVAGSQVLQNIDFSSGGAAWTFRQETNTSEPGTVEYVGGTAKIQTKGGDSYAAIYQKFNIAERIDAMFSLTIKSALNFGAVEPMLKIRIGTAPGTGEVLSRDLHEATKLQGQVWPYFVTLDPGEYYVWLEVRHDYANSGYGYCNVELDNVSLEFARPGAGTDAIVTPWSYEQLPLVQFAQEGGRNRLYAAHPNVAPWYLQYESPTVWTGAAMPITPPTDSGWGGVNWPGIVEIHDGRLYLAATPAEQNHVWASKAGEPFTFTPIAADKPGDPLDYKVATAGCLRWIKGQRGVLAATDISAHSMSGSKGIPLNGDFFVRKETSHGAAPVQPVDVGSSIAYVTSDRRRIRVPTYSQDGGGWSSKDLTFLAEHITAGNVKEIHYLTTPDGMVVVLLHDGTLAACTYDEEEKVAAWWRVDLRVAPPTGVGSLGDADARRVDGFIRSVAPSQGPRGAFLWMAVERNGSMYLERLPLSETADVQYLDFSIRGVAGGNGIFTHPLHAQSVEEASMGIWPTPEGDKLRVLVDGKYVGDFEQFMGMIILGPEYAGRSFVAGYPYRAVAKTLPVEGGNKAGTSQGMKVHYTDLTARLNRSARPLLNGERATEDRPFARSLATPDVLITADARTKSLKVEEGGVVTIEQDLPFRTEVCAVYAQAAITKV